jgi:hypothetical protein
MEEDEQTYILWVYQVLENPSYLSGLLNMAETRRVLIPSFYNNDVALHIRLNNFC